MIFQANPFGFLGADINRPVVHFHEEIADYILGQHPVNSLWVRDLYGAAVHDAVKDHHVSCSGFTLGSRSGMEVYLRTMADEIAGRFDPKARAFPCPVPIPLHCQTGTRAAQHLHVRSVMCL